MSYPYNAAGYWLVRRRVSEIEGTVTIYGIIAKLDITQGGFNSGIIGHFYIDGTEVFSQYIAGTNGVAVDLTVRH